MTIHTAHTHAHAQLLSALARARQVIAHNACLK